MIEKMIIKASDLPRIRKKYADHTIMLGNGVFDLLHEGHLRALERMKELADRLVPGKPGLLIVMLGDDRLVNKNKPSTFNVQRPVRDQEERVRFINGLKVVDFVFVGAMEDCPKGDDWPDMTYVRSLKPDMYKVGSAYWEKYYEEMNDQNTLPVQVFYPSKLSTTAIIARIVEQSRAESSVK